MLLYVLVIATIYWFIDGGETHMFPQSRTGIGSAVGVLVGSGEVHRLITAAFIHNSVSHLFSNAVGLIVFGSWVEAVIGWKRTMVLLTMSTIAGYGVALALIDNSSHYYGAEYAGASAALTGLVGAFVVSLLLRSDDFPVFFRLPVVLFVWAALLVLRTGEGVATIAHVAGFLAGFLGMVWMCRKRARVPPNDSPWARVAALASIVAISLSGVAVAFDDALFGKDRYALLLGDRLEQVSISDDELLQYVTMLAAIRDAPTDMLERGRDSIWGLMNRNPSMYAKYALAKIEARLGEYRVAIETMRELWHDDPDPNAAGRLALFYSQALASKDFDDQRLVGELIGMQGAAYVEHVGQSEQGAPSFRVEPYGPRSEKVSVQILLSLDDELRGFVEVTVEPEVITLECDVIGSEGGGHIEWLPVWVSRSASEAPLPSNTCTIIWFDDYLGPSVQPSLTRTGVSSWGAAERLSIRRHER